MKNPIEVLTAIAGLIGLIYAAFKVETAIYKSIDDLGKLLNARINSVDRDLSLHIAVYSERKEQVNLHLHGLEEKIEHMKKRLLDEIKELEAEVKRKKKLED